MYQSRETNDDPRSHKRQRAVKRARGKQPEEHFLEPGEHHQRAENGCKRRSSLSIDDAEMQIRSYFDPD